MASGLLPNADPAELLLGVALLDPGATYTTSRLLSASQSSLYSLPGECSSNKAGLSAAWLTSIFLSTSLMPVCPLSLHVTATLLETSLARAIHRFVIEDEEEGQNQLVVSGSFSRVSQNVANQTGFSQLWVFNPYIRLFSNHPTFESSASINATKILYKAGKLAE